MKESQVESQKSTPTGIGQGAPDDECKNIAAIAPDCYFSAVLYFNLIIFSSFNFEIRVRDNIDNQEVQARSRCKTSFRDLSVHTLGQRVRS